MYISPIDVHVHADDSLRLSRESLVISDTSHTTTTGGASVIFVLTDSANIVSAIKHLRPIDHASASAMALVASEMRPTISRRSLLFAFVYEVFAIRDTDDAAYDVVRSILVYAQQKADAANADITDIAFFLDADGVFASSLIGDNWLRALKDVDFTRLRQEHEILHTTTRRRR